MLCATIAAKGEFMSTKHRRETQLVELGRDPKSQLGVVNPPVYHASTVTFEKIADLAFPGDKTDKPHYGRFGTPTISGLEKAVAELEGGWRSYVTPSGLSAISASLLALVAPGDHLLVADTVYGPTRFFCDRFLGRLGVETTYYAPTIGGGIQELFRPTTKAVFIESPGSLTFEMQDVPAICEQARRRGILTLMDNTWASPWFCRPFDLGVDVSIQAATKYIVGHSDAMLGMVTTSEQSDAVLRTAIWDLGLTAGPDDCYLALRGVRTLGVRLARHQENGLELAAWLESRPEVARVLHPGLPSHPQHHIWKRDFSGASGLFGVVLRPCAAEGVRAMLEGMRLFKMGYSFGGYESLILPTRPEATRSVVPWRAEGPCLRLHAGLEHVDDMRADLEDAFARLRAG
jgi:cysteine-S-conjugate beta-lyase